LRARPATWLGGVEGATSGATTTPPRAVATGPRIGPVRLDPGPQRAPRGLF